MPKGTKLSDRVTLGVRADILSCRLRPGTRLRIADICKTHGVSLGAVREALSRLSAEGLVVAEPQKGFAVAPVSLIDLDDLTETRIDIEQLCLSRSLKKGGIDWETQVVAAQHRLRCTPEREEVGQTSLLTEEWSRAHNQFHESLAAACGSPTLLEIRTNLYARSERYRRLSIPLDRQGRDIASEHDQIVEAALARDVAKIKRLIAKHLRATTQIIRESAEILQLSAPNTHATVP